MARTVVLLTAAVGYVLGSRAGRGPYDTVAARSREAWQGSRVRPRLRQAATLGRYRPEEHEAPGTERHLAPDG